jgi:hypothetical protein
MNSIVKNIFAYIAVFCFGVLGAHAQTTQEDVTVYEGHYTCSQGPTRLTLIVLAPDYQGLQQAVFAFAPTPQNPNVPVGEFILSGRVDTVPSGFLDLRQSRWIRRPSGFEMVDLMGRVSGDGKFIQGRVMMNGAILNGCTDFSVKRVK